MMEHYTKETFDAALNSGKLMMVDFSATWCGPCKMLSPVMEELADRYAGKAETGKVDVDEEPELAMRYGIQGVPTVIFFRDGKELDRLVGMMPPEAYTSFLDKTQ